MDKTIIWNNFINFVNFYGIISPKQIIFQGERMKKIALVALALSSSLLFADNSAYKYEFTPMVGAVVPEGNLDLENQLAYGGSFGVNLDSEKFFDQIELGYLRSSDIDYDNSNQDTNFNRFFVNLIKDYALSSKTSLYGLVGVGYEDLSNEMFDNEDSGFFNYGLGLKYKVAQNFFAKFDVRHLIKFNHSDNNVIFTAGIGIPFGKVAQPEAPKKSAPILKDSDGDGVYDKDDKCPNTVAGATVDMNGCEVDSDHDGVFDSQDKCPNTPEGVAVNTDGCPLDSDHDGVIDANDKCPNTVAGVKVNSDGCPVAMTLRLNFDTDKAVIKPEYMDKLKEYANYLKKVDSYYDILVKGYTDSTGSASYNKKLSKMRAIAVRTKLVQFGVNPAKIKAIGYGEEDPIATNKTKEGRYLNRRVVIELDRN